MVAVSLSRLSKHFPGGVCAVDDLCLEVGDRELLVLMGPSGCGKTTTLRLIAGLERPSGGRITIAGRPAEHLPPRRRDVAMVFQQGALYPHLSVRGNLAFGLKLRGTPAGEISLRVEDAARMLGIADLLDRSPGDLSYGQQQRVALGRAVVRRPALFLLDEPLANLDAALRRQLRREIRSLHQRLGTTMIYVTHDPGEAMALGQRIAILHGGRLQQAADPQALYDRPVNRFVASALGSPGMNFLDGRLEYSDGRGWFAMGGDVVVALPDRCREPLQSRAAGPITLGARPEHVRVMAGDDGLAIDRRHFLVVPAVVEQTEWHGGESQVHLAVVGQSLIARFDGGVRPAVSEQVHAVVAAEDLRFFDAGTGEAIVA